MRVNQPVSQREYSLPEGTTLLSTTDTQSHIRYANAAFISVSGFDRDEIMGQPHNLVRHPDMPPEAFADMWATLKAGESWTALVKNRRKDGDHYWVRANAAPMVRNRRVVGYLSVRTKPGADEVRGAEELYRKFRTGQAKGLAFHKGLIVRTGLLAWTSWLQRMSVAWRIRSALALLWLMHAALVLFLGAEGTATLLGAHALLALTAGWWLESQIAAPLRLVREQALKVAAGNSDPAPGLNRVDDIGMILRAVNQSGLNLRSLVSDVDEQVGGLNIASAEIASGNNDLSARTEQTASSLQQTAASMEELHATLKNSADSAQQAATLANHASKAATDGGSVMLQVVKTMDEISGSSRRIADIIGTIDGIAFQTNILALNAAVEAARAGEAGRGFAVVASEVRALAGRSADAAREIKQLIGSSVERIESGSRLVDQAGHSIDGIVTQVQRVDQLIADISRATREQTTGVGEVNAAVSSLDQSTQQNAALVEQSAASAESLKGQASRLAEALEVFRA